MLIFPHKIDINFVKLQYSIFKTLCNHDRKERIPFKRRIINVKKGSRTLKSFQGRKCQDGDKVFSYKFLF